jgi:hypothetical protein
MIFRKAFFTAVSDAVSRVFFAAAPDSDGVMQLQINGMVTQVHRYC